MSNYVSPGRGGGDIIIVFCSVVVIVCVIPCEHNNFWDVLNFIFKLEPCIDHIKVSDKFENYDDLHLDLQGQTGVETFKILVLIFSKINRLKFYLQTWTVYSSFICHTWFGKLVTLTLIFKVTLGFRLPKFLF